MKRGILLFVLLILTPGIARALGPHEILLILNTNSPVSMRIGGAYARLRRVPEANVVSVGAPTGGAISAETFRETLYGPILAEARSRGIQDHILAWVYAPDFPWKITGPPDLSLTGLTFLRGVPPEPQSASAGSALSPYFAGPNSPGERGYETRSLCMLSEWMGDEKPIAAWALAHVGERGLTADEAGAMLIRGVDSDGARPEGVFCFVTNADIRAKVREWQIPVALEELAEMGFKTRVTPTLPRGVEPVAGLFMGMASFETAGTRLAPGAVVDNLTSFGAAFDVSSQTKCTAWLRAGASAAGGAVVEPFSYWTKFPNARLLAHYAAGCTAIESFYQSLRQPLQFLPLGDPLAAPWKPKGEVHVEGVDEVLAGTRQALKISVRHGEKGLWNSCEVLVDGRVDGRGNLDDPYPWNPAKWGPGRHELRVVVRTAGLLRHQVFTVRPYTHAPPEAP